MTRNLFLLTAALIFFSSCKHYYYAPNTLQTPFLQQQHDAKISAGLITGDEMNGFELHGVYSPVKYGAVMINHLSVTSSETGSTSEWGKGNLTEIAAGGYYPLGKYTSFSLFGGWGAGHALNSYDIDVLADLHFQRLFLQPTVAIQGSWFRFGTAVRLNQLRYVRGDVDYEIDQNELAVIENIEKSSPIFFPEVGLSVGFGYRFVWADFHVNICDAARREELGFVPSTLGVDFNFVLDEIWRKKPGSKKK